MKKILIATDNKFWEKDSGSKQRISTLMGFLLNRNFHVDLFHTLALSAEEIAVIGIDYPGLSVHINHKGLNKPVGLGGRIYAALFGPQPTLVERSKSGITKFACAETSENFNRLVNDLRPDFVIVEYIRLSYLIEGLAPKARSRLCAVIDTHDVMSDRCRQFKREGLDHWVEINDHEEAQILTLFDWVISIQPQDAKKFIAMGVKHIINVGYCIKARGKVIRDDYPIDIAYVSADNDANRVAIEKFIDSVWPRILKSCGDKVNLRIFGGVCASLNSPDSDMRISLEGRFDDIESVYAQADIIVNPVNFGGGLKIKNVEALCHSLPLVTTSIGAEGMEAGINSAFYLCDTDKEQIDALTRLIENFPARQALSQAAYAFSNEFFSERLVYKELLEVLEL